MSLSTVEHGDARRTEAVVTEAADVLRGGGLVVIPTETVYGVAGLATSDEAVARLRGLRAGGRAVAMTVHVADPEDCQRYADLAFPAGRRALA